MEGVVSRIPRNILTYRMLWTSSHCPQSITLLNKIRCLDTKKSSNCRREVSHRRYQIYSSNYYSTATTTSPSISTSKTTPTKKSESWVDKVRRWMNWEKKPPKSLLRASGYLWYVKIADEINFDSFYEVCKLPDTFSSWFTVAELHVWLLSARLMEEPETGKIIRNSVIRAMWEDVDARSKKLEGALSDARKLQIKELNEQFQATLLSYDEGLLAPNDTTLAGALWRKFLRQAPLSPDEAENTQPSQTRLLLDEVIALELLVSYVRSEHFRLQQLSRERMIFKRDFKWSPFDKRLVELKKFYSS